jgi:hypothetical protein
VGLKQPHNYVH